jgi:hypothetical protein
MDWANGAADDRADRLRLEGINQCMDSCPTRRTAGARRWSSTRATSHAHMTVWYSPVLPATREERDVLILEARNKLLNELRRKDLIG